MRVAVLLLMFSAVVFAGCCGSRATCVAPSYGPSTAIVRVSEVYSEVYSETTTARAGTIVRESAVYSDPMHAATPRVAATFVPPPPPALPTMEAKPVACTPVVPTARPARTASPTPRRRVCIPLPRLRRCTPCPPPAAEACVGGNCGVPSLDDCPGGNCGIPSLDACAPPMKFDPCAK